MRAPDLTITPATPAHSGLVPAAEMRYGVAQVTEEARDGWLAFADRFHIDRTALAEVMGLRMATLEEPLPEPLATWVEEARRLKNQRRRR